MFQWESQTPLQMHLKVFWQELSMKNIIFGGPRQQILNFIMMIPSNQKNAYADNWSKVLNPKKMTLSSSKIITVITTKVKISETKMKLETEWSTTRIVRWGYSKEQVTLLTKTRLCWRHLDWTSVDLIKNEAFMSFHLISKETHVVDKYSWKN